MIDKDEHTTSRFGRNGNERFVIFVGCSDGTIPSENPTRNALQKEMKRLTDLGVFSSAGAENELQERAFSGKLEVCQIVHLDADFSVKTSTA